MAISLFETLLERLFLSPADETLQMGSGEVTVLAEVVWGYGESLIHGLIDVSFCAPTKP